MKKRMMWVLSAVIGISAFLFVGNMSYAEAAADNNVNIAIEFEKEEYFPGETAKACIKITGIGDEVEAGYKLGTLETGIKFDASRLRFKTAEYKVMSENSSECSIALAGAEAESDLIVAIFYSGAGVDYTAQADGSFVLAELEFETLEAVSGEASVGFDNIYESMFVLPQSQGYVELTCAMAEGVKVNITSYDYIIESGGATMGDTEITDSVTVRAEDGSVPVAKLIAGLYEKDGDLLLAQVIIKSTDLENAPYDIGFEIPADSAGKQYEIRYHLWNSLIFASPYASQVTAVVE